MQLSLDQIRGLSSLSYPLCGYLELFVFPFSIIGVPLFLPQETGIYHETIFGI